MDKNNKNSFENYEKRISEEFENSTIFNSSETSENKINHKKRKNNSYVKLLCALLCLIIVLGSGIFSVVKFWPEDVVEETTSEAEATISLTADANISLNKMKNADKNAVSNVKKIVVKNETDEFICVPYKTTTVDEEGNETEQVCFRLVGVDEEIPINNDYVTAFYDGVFDVNAISKLDSKWTEADCGLDNPKILVNVTMADGSEFDIKVGNEVATSDGYYYASTSLKDGIYIADGTVYETFSADFNSLVDLTLFYTITENDENSKYFSNGQLSIFDSIKINGKNFSNVELSYNDSDEDVMSYHIEEPVKTYADDEKISTLLSPLSSGLSASTIYKIKPNADDLEKFGLNEPYFEIVYSLNNKTYNLKLSKPGIVDKNYCACVVNDVPVIYAILSDNISFVNWKLDDLRYSLLYLKDIETFESYTVKYNGKTYKYALSFDKAESTDDETTAEEEKILSVVLNSSPIDSDSFKTAYQRLTMASATKYLGENITLNRAPDLTFEIELNNGKTDVITYTKYNEIYYLHKLNGIGDELIPARTIESLILNYEKLRKGEEVISPNNQQ